MELVIHEIYNTFKADADEINNKAFNILLCPKSVIVSDMLNKLICGHSFTKYNQIRLFHRISANIIVFVNKQNNIYMVNQNLLYAFTLLRNDILKSGEEIKTLILNLNDCITAKILNNKVINGKIIKLGGNLTYIFILTEFGNFYVIYMIDPKITIDIISVNVLDFEYTENRIVYKQKKYDEEKNIYIFIYKYKLCGLEKMLEHESLLLESRKNFNIFFANKLLILCDENSSVVFTAYHLTYKQHQQHYLVNRYKIIFLDGFITTNNVCTTYDKISYISIKITLNTTHEMLYRVVLLSDYTKIKERSIGNYIHIYRVDSFNIYYICQRYKTSELSFYIIKTNDKIRRLNYNNNGYSLIFNKNETTNDFNYSKEEYLKNAKIVRNEIYIKKEITIKKILKSINMSEWLYHFICCMKRLNLMLPFLCIEEILNFFDNYDFICINNYYNLEKNCDNNNNSNDKNQNTKRLISNDNGDDNNNNNENKKQKLNK